MKIIIEGADGSGKSTLAKKLSDLYDLDVVHMRGRDIMTFPFTYHTLDKVDVIWDRHFLSERIYSKFYNLPYRLTKGQERVLFQKTLDQDIVILVCIPEEPRIVDGEDEDIVKRHEELSQGYRDICWDLGIIPIDPFTMTVEEIESFIDNDSWRG